MIETSSKDIGPSWHRSSRKCKPRRGDMSVTQYFSAGSKGSLTWHKEGGYHVCHPQPDWMLLVYQEVGSLIWKYEVVHSDGHDFEIMANGNMRSKRLEDAKDMSEKEFGRVKRESFIKVLGMFASFLFLGLAVSQMGRDLDKKHKATK